MMILNDDIKSYEHIRKYATSQGDYYTTGCLLGYPYFKKFFKMVDLRKQQELYVDPWATQQISFRD